MAELDPTTFRPETKALHAGPRVVPQTPVLGVAVGVDLEPVGVR